MKQKILDEHLAAHVAELFSAFSDTSRVRILSAIIEQEANVSALARIIGLTESAVSHHMRGLRRKAHRSTRWFASKPGSPRW